ncbi:hypothetical protein Glove_43g19 [Diversispora epigaea]|uniref:Uncharacterized protein n=1 Tax=Diversispora epigaea TaxID=1348612 RepID=A0A397JJ64_9GLOM|nr:hypothetical protein Glove_43g19 [Diversispora epigaea]
MVEKESRIIVSIAKRNIDEFYNSAFSNSCQNKSKNCGAKYSTDLDTSSNSDTSNSSSSFTSSSESEDNHVYKTVAVIHLKQCRKESKSTYHLPYSFFQLAPLTLETKASKEFLIM